jgi:hypothetical protein
MMKISAIFYAIVILAFLMPFFVVSCDTTELASLKGIKLVTGGEVKITIPEIMQDMQQDENKINNPSMSAQPFAIVAIVLAVAALILVLALPVKMYLLPAIVSILGIISLQLLNANIMSVLSSTKTGLDPSIDLSSIMSIKTQSGFWLANIAFILGGVFTIILGMKNQSKLALSPQAVEEVSASIISDENLSDWEGTENKTFSEVDDNNIISSEENETVDQEEEEEEKEKEEKEKLE